MRNSYIFLLLSAFTSIAMPADVNYYMVVAADGSGDYASIQAAIDNTKSFPDKRITIFVKNGIYNEKVKVHEWNNLLSIIGESKDGVVITFDDHFKKIDKGRNSTFYTATLTVDGDDFKGENLTIKNTAGPVGQAVALSVNADRVAFYDSHFLGWQDTLYLTGENKRVYFKDCYIEGSTDFIFGRATAVFENCEVRSKADSYITAASTPQGVDYGFVFLDCALTADEGIGKVYLGRPWRPYAKVVFINTAMGSHILPEGWHNWSKPEAEKTTFYAEFNSHGDGGDILNRVKWSKLLSKKQARGYTPEKILGKYMGKKWFVKGSE